MLDNMRGCPHTHNVLRKEVVRLCILHSGDMKKVENDLSPEMKKLFIELGMNNG